MSELMLVDNMTMTNVIIVLIDGNYTDFDP